MTDTALSERAPLRVLSWLLATPLALLLLIHPGAMLDSQGRYSHSLLMLVMLRSRGLLGTRLLRLLRMR